MKVIHVPCYADVDLKLSDDAINNLPKYKFGVLTSAQHLHNIDDVVEQIKGVKGGQVLGCNASNALKINGVVDAFLFVGTGMFHALNIAWKTEKPVWIWNPVSKTLTKIEDSEVKKFIKRKHAGFTKFSMSENIGIIVSLKYGQKDFAHALDFSKRDDKNYFIFACDTFDFSETENFPFVECWINSACPRISDEKPLINLDELAEFLDFKFSTSVERPIWKSTL